MSDKIVCNCEIKDDEKQTYELTGHCYNCCPSGYSHVHDEYAYAKSKNWVPEGWECDDWPNTDEDGWKGYHMSSQGVLMHNRGYQTFYYIKPGINVTAFMEGIEDYVKSLPPAAKDSTRWFLDGDISQSLVPA